MFAGYRGQRACPALRDALAVAARQLRNLLAGRQVDPATSPDYLRRQGTPVPTNDLWIAASAAQHGLVVLTLDSDFERIPQVLVRRFDP